MSSSSPPSSIPSADIDTSRRRNRQQQPGGQRSDDDDDDDDNNKPKCYIIITNISKKPNVRSLLLLAAAFGIRTIFVAGQKKFDFSAAEGSSSTDLPHQLRAMVRDGQMDIVRFDRLDECIAHIKSIGAEDDDAIDEVGAGACNRQQRRPIRVVGVEIDPSSEDVEGEPFEGDTAFMMGNEGQGMNEKQMSLCDGFVKIAQYGGGTASLNVYVAASIVLHRFHHWARGDDVRRYCDTS